MTLELKARLRKASVKAKLPGSAENKEKCIDLFLEEVSQLLAFKLLAAVDDDTLYRLYYRWLQWNTKGMDAQQRQQLLVESVVFMPPLTAKMPPPKADNVVSLFGG